MDTLREIRSYSLIFSLKKDSIVEIRPIPGWSGTPSLANAKKDMECLKILSDGKRYPSLCYLPDVILSREIRSYFADHEPLSVASALIVKNPFQRILGNFFIGINKVQVPVKLFADETEARAWLRGFLPEKSPEKKAAVFA
jgi:hypothetical protein